MKNENVRIILLGLLDGCPFTYDERCPIKDMRKLPDKEKHEWVKGLDIEQINEIVDAHEKCFWERMNKEN